VTSIDRDAGKHAMARENLAAADLLRHVDLVLGDATEIAARLAGPFDCVFFDADRVSAPKQLDLLLFKLSLPALLLADNATSHPDQIAGYLARMEAIGVISPQDHSGRCWVRLGKRAFRRSIKNPCFRAIHLPMCWRSLSPSLQTNSISS
jgi:hypothetical protein